MAEDIREQDLAAVNDCEWIRALDANGNSIKISKADLTELILPGGKKVFSVPAGRTVGTGLSLEGAYLIHVAYTGNVSTAVISSYANTYYISNGAGLSADKTSGFYFGRQETNGEIYLINNTGDSDRFVHVTVERL